MQCVQEMRRLALKQPPPGTDKLRQVLTEAVEFMFRAQQFVSGLDPATRDVFVVLNDVVEQVGEGRYDPHADTAVEAATAAAGGQAVAAPVGGMGVAVKAS